MRGDPNTKVSLTIFRKDESRTFPVTIVREEIRVQSVRARMVEPGYAWIRISQFQDRTVDDFAKKLEDLYKQDPNIKGMVLDLRNDPGGLLDGAVAVAATFLPNDDVVVTTNGQIAESKATFKASPEYYARRGGGDPLRRLPAALKTVPLVVLVNEGSASASEIVAGALQDHHRATLVGTRSFGEGAVATLIPLGRDAGVIHLTTGHYVTPSGRVIEKKGISPDVEVAQDLPDDLKPTSKAGGDQATLQSWVPADPQADKALTRAFELLRKTAQNTTPSRRAKN
jgi:carboxyl-terminal processing protease